MASKLWANVSKLRVYLKIIDFQNIFIFKKIFLISAY